MEELRAQDAEGFASNEPIELSSCTDISAPDNLIDNFHLDICTPASSMDETLPNIEAQLNATSGVDVLITI